MGEATPIPIRLTGLTALRWAWRFARDPLMTTCRTLDVFGPFVMLSDALPFTPPLTKPHRVVLLGVPLVLTAGAEFHRELLSDTATWRGVSLLPGGPRNSAARRISLGLTRTTGGRHAHYRKLLACPLRKASVNALIEDMARLAEAEVESWPAGESINLWEYARRLMRRFAVELLFGGNSEQGYLIADLLSQLMEGKWGPSAFLLPIHLPITSYGRIVRKSELLERHLLKWAGSKRGRIDVRDPASIIVNSPDADGDPQDDAAIVGQIPSLFAAAFEAGQSALTWTLILLMQHPRIMAEVFDELSMQVGTASPSLNRAGDLPFLDAVVKEAMRILPPVPLQIRVAQYDTTIATHSTPKGTRVILNALLTSRMSEVFPEGDVFRPERWFKIAPTVFEFPVFSGGPHSCPGYWFGLSAVKVALAAILTRYRMALPAGVRIDYMVQPTLRPLDSIPVFLHRQDGAFASMPVSGKIRNLVRFPQ